LSNNSTSGKPMMEMIPAMMMQVRICKKYQARNPTRKIIRRMKKSLYFSYKEVIFLLRLPDLRKINMKE
jgi:hypothetical protein